MRGIAEVAKRAGVSKSTASRALTGRGYVSDETKKRVEKAAADLAYVPSTPAVSLATGRTQTIGVIVPHLTHWYFGEVVDGIQSALNSRNLDCALFSAKPESNDRKRMFETYLGRRRFDGLIAVGIEPSANELERIASLGRPLVTIGSYDAGTCAVSIDDYDTALRATQHVLGLGHEEVLFLGGTASTGNDSYGDERRIAGYRAAMTTAGFGDRARHVPCDVNMPAGYAAAVDLLSARKTRPTAIVAVSDEVAIGAIIAARRQGIGVPNDLSVIGIDDHANAEMFSLTTLRQNPHEQGEKAVSLLIEMIESPHTVPSRVWAPSTLIIRSSTAAYGVAV